MTTTRKTKTTGKTQRGGVEPVVEPEPVPAFVEALRANDGAVGAYPLAEHEAMTPFEAVSADGAMATAVPTTVHQSELDRELLYFNYRGRTLLWRLFWSTFRHSIWLSRPTLEHPGSKWNEGEEATYGVQLYNNTLFDLEGMQVTLSVTSLGGKAAILGPVGSVAVLGDVPFGQWSDTARFELKAVTQGDVRLDLEIEGYMSPMRLKQRYNGVPFGSTLAQAGYRTPRTIAEPPTPDD